jgi:Mycobacterium membrane protein
MTRLIGRAWVPMVMVVVVAVRSLAVSRLGGVLGSHVSVPDSGTADLVIQFELNHVICEIYGPVGRPAAGVFRCCSEPAKDAGDCLVTGRVSQLEQGIVFGSIEALPHDHRGVVHGRHLEAQEAGDCSKS